MIGKIIKEIGIEETWRNIEEQRFDDIYIWILYWNIQSRLNEILIGYSLKMLKEEGLIK